ncbi:unnamed protein product [Porites evermanni]|uniref:Protein JTB n=1 Tax=Porites evermanni TaxID=104178 RepID=A0ABN8MI05_9CNID|nr:unnamed protein product [Porites evermanni]
MKQWRIIVIVSGLIILLLIANFSIQIKKRSTKNKENSSRTSSAVADLNTTLRPTVIEYNSTNSLAENAKNVPNSKCWKKENTRLIGDCIHCSDYEKQTISGCLEFGNIQQGLCISSNVKFYKSCPHVLQWEEKKFWMFTGLMLLGLICSSLLVWYRQRQLDKVFYQKLQRQVESDTI